MVMMMTMTTTPNGSDDDDDDDVAVRPCRRDGVLLEAAARRRHGRDLGPQDQGRAALQVKEGKRSLAARGRPRPAGCGARPRCLHLVAHSIGGELSGGGCGFRFANGWDVTAANIVATVLLFESELTQGVSA
jgi:hypothetical protein